MCMYYIYLEGITRNLIVVALGREFCYYLVVSDYLVREITVHLGVLSCAQLCCITFLKN